MSSLKTDHHSQKKWDFFNSDLRLLHGIFSFNQLLLKFKEDYIHVNQHFHVAKQCQNIIGSHGPQLVPAGGFLEKRAVKFFFGDIDFNTSSIHFISDIIWMDHRI